MVAFVYTCVLLKCFEQLLEIDKTGLKAYTHMVQSTSVHG